MKRSEFFPYKALYDAVAELNAGIPEGVKERMDTLDYVEIDAEMLKKILAAFESAAPVDINPIPRAKRKAE